jgi:hypothetical protein
MASEALLTTLDAARDRIARAQSLAHDADRSVQALADAAECLEQVVRVILRVLQGDERAAEELGETEA